MELVSQGHSFTSAKSEKTSPKICNNDSLAAGALMVIVVGGGWWVGLVVPASVKFGTLVCGGRERNRDRRAVLCYLFDEHRSDDNRVKE
eukprot:scaffold3043_cov180-Amphora_coffeaeformis.AAC.12